MRSWPILALEHEIEPQNPPAAMDQQPRSTSSFPSEQEVQHGSSSRRMASSSPTEFDPQQPFSSSQSRLRSYSTTAACFPILPNPQELTSTSPPRSRYTARPTSYQGPSSDFRHFASTYPTPPTQSRSRSPTPLAHNCQHGPSNIPTHPRRQSTIQLPPLSTFVQGVEREPYPTPMPRTRGLCVFDLDHQLSEAEIRHLCSGHGMFVIEEVKIFLQPLHSTIGGREHPSNWPLQGPTTTLTVQVEYLSKDMATEAMVWLCSIRVACRCLRVEYAQDPTIRLKDYIPRSIAAPDSVQIPAMARRVIQDETEVQRIKGTGVSVAKQETSTILIADLPPTVGASEVWNFLVEKHRFAMKGMEVFRGGSGAVEQARVNLASVEAAREAIRLINGNFWAGNTIHVLFDRGLPSFPTGNGQQTSAVSLFGWPGSSDTSSIQTLLSHAGQLLHTEFYGFSKSYPGLINVTAVYGSALEAYRALFMFDGLLLDEGRFRVTGFGHGPGLQQPALPPAQATTLHLGSAYQPSPDGKPGASATRGLFLQNIPADLQDESLYKPLGIRPDVGEPRLSFLSCGAQNCSAVLVRYNSATIAALERRRLDNFTLCGFTIRACFDHQLAVRDEDYGCNEGLAAPGLPSMPAQHTQLL